MDLLIGQKHCLSPKKTTDGKAVCLRIGIAVDGRITSVQVPVPSTCATLARRPEVRVGSHIVETTIGIAVTGGYQQKTTA